MNHIRHNNDVYITMSLRNARQLIEAFEKGFTQGLPELCLLY